MTMYAFGRKRASRARHGAPRLGVALVALVVGVVGLPVLASRASAEVGPTGVEYHRLTFPVEGSVRYTNDWGACRGTGCSRGHVGTDIMGTKLQRLLAAEDGVIQWLRGDSSGTSGNMLSLKGKSGWIYWYIHINNDSPFTDDGTNPAQWRFAPGMAAGVSVKAGQFIAYMGDSGNAEGTAPHLHFELHKPDGTYSGVAINPYPSLQLAQGIPAAGLCRFPTNPKPAPLASSARGYWTLRNDGAVDAFGQVQHFGGANGRTSTVDLAGTPSGNGYWITDTSGAVLTFGGAKHFGDTATMQLNAQVIGMTPTRSGNGYWLLARDGGVFSFGDARFYGSMGGTRLNAPVIAMAATSTGAGYWLLGADGGVFSFGDAQFYGSTGSMVLAQPVIGMTPSASGKGYWLLGRDGGIFAFGLAAFKGSLPGDGLCSHPPAVAFTGTRTGNGYYVLTADGHITPFGDAPNHGDPQQRGFAAKALEVLST
jgi:hypothetical protein